MNRRTFMQIALLAIAKAYVPLRLNTLAPQLPPVLDEPVLTYDWKTMSTSFIVTRDEVFDPRMTGYLQWLVNEKREALTRSLQEHLFEFTEE